METTSKPAIRGLVDVIFLTMRMWQSMELDMDLILILEESSCTKWVLVLVLWP